MKKEKEIKRVDKRPDLVILEGPDKAGKSTIYQAFRKATDYQPLVIDRFIGSNIVFDQLYDRLVPGQINHYYQIEERLGITFNPLVVYLTAPLPVLLDRSEKAGDIEEEEFDIRSISEFYTQYLNDTPLDVISIDTAGYDVSQTVEIITEVLNSRRV